MTIEHFAHKASYGLTTFGKTYIAKRRMEFQLKHRQQVVVYAGNLDTDFPKGVDYVYDADELEAYLANPDHFGAFVYIDEADLLFEDVTQDHEICNNITKRGRHLGYTVWLISQYPNAIPKRQRRNCFERFMFSMGDYEDAVALWKDCGKISYEGKPLCDWLMELPKFAFFHYKHPGQITYYPDGAP